MKKLLIAMGVLLSFAVTANAKPEWQSKPVQCSGIQEIYQAYIYKNKLKPLFIGITTAATHDMKRIAVPIIFYMNDVGQWLMIEVGEDDWSCVIGLGDGFDSSITEEVLNEILLGAKGT